MDNYKYNMLFFVDNIDNKINLPNENIKYMDQNYRNDCLITLAWLAQKVGPSPLRIVSIKYLNTFKYYFDVGHCALIFI